MPPGFLVPDSFAASLPRSTFGATEDQEEPCPRTSTSSNGPTTPSTGDGQALALVLAEDLHWRGTADERVPRAGTVKSRADALAALERTREAFAAFSNLPDKFVEQGDTVVVLGHTEAQT